MALQKRLIGVYFFAVNDNGLEYLGNGRSAKSRLLGRRKTRNTKFRHEPSSPPNHPMGLTRE